MKIKEFKLISKKENGTFPDLKCIKEYEFLYDEAFIYCYHDNFEFEYMFFSDIIELQKNYVEYFYVMSYDETDEPLGILQLSSGGRNNTIIPYDTLFTYLLLTGSKSFITIHNHPSGNSEKSFEDIITDNSIKSFSDMLNITYKQGLIITKNITKDLNEKRKKFEQENYDNEEYTIFDE